MGLYDTINNEQVKCFNILYPIVVDGNVNIHTVGGNLRNIKKSSTAPYKTWYYNMGKDFDIVDTHFPKNKKIVVHRVRNGINIGKKTLNKIKNEELCETIYDYYGNEYKKNITKEELRKIIDLRLQLLDINFGASGVLSLWGEYLRSDKEKDEKILKEFEEEYETLHNRELEERKPIYEEIESYYEEKDFMSKIPDEYFKFGVLSEKIRNFEKTSLNTFFMTDPRLNTLLIIEELEKIKQNIDLNKYFEFLCFDTDEKEEFLNTLNNINKIKELCKSKEYNKEELNVKRVDEYAINNEQMYKHFGIKPYVEYQYNEVCEER